MKCGSNSIQNILETPAHVLTLKAFSQPGLFDRCSPISLPGCSSALSAGVLRAPQGRWSNAKGDGELLGWKKCSPAQQTAPYSSPAGSSPLQSPVPWWVQHTPVPIFQIGSEPIPILPLADWHVANLSHLAGSVPPKLSLRPKKNVHIDI